MKRPIDEALPGPSQDPADYTVDIDQFQRSLAYLKDRFIQTHGVEAWEQHKNMFVQELLKPDPEISPKMRGIHRYKPLQRDFPGAKYTPRQESLVRKVIGT